LRAVVSKRGVDDGNQKGGLLSAKGGLMMGTKKVGVFSSPQKKTTLIIFKK
jgi:hypothetical protein